MDRRQVWPDKFKKFFLNNKFVVGLLIALLVGLTILVFSKIPFVFKPLSVLLHTVAAPLLLSGIAYYLLNPLVGPSGEEKPGEAGVWHCHSVSDYYRNHYSGAADGHPDHPHPAHGPD